MEDVRDLKALQIDALREVANIGAGHAATALSQMTGRKIMIDMITGSSIQASRARIARPQPTEPRREGCADPGTVAAT